jgi:hypothetical protein
MSATLWGVETYAGNLVGGGVLDDGDETLKLLGGKLTGALVQVDIGLLAHKVGWRARVSGVWVGGKMKDVQ